MCRFPQPSQQIPICFIMNIFNNSQNLCWKSPLSLSFCPVIPENLSMWKNKFTDKNIYIFPTTLILFQIVWRLIVTSLNSNYSDLLINLIYLVRIWQKGFCLCLSLLSQQEAWINVSVKISFAFISILW